MIEFAIVAPVFLMLGLGGIELFNYLLCIWRVNEVALETADNASRVGVNSGLATQQLREVDMNDVLAAARLQGKRVSLIENGRVTISSLENPDGKQWIHWQRCIGLRTGTGFDSSQGKEGDGGATGKAIAGMGSSLPQVTAPARQGVMFVEVNYRYQPILLGWLFSGEQTVHFEQAFIVRDKRDFTQIYPTLGQTASTCNVARA